MCMLSLGFLFLFHPTLQKNTGMWIPDFKLSLVETSVWRCTYVHSALFWTIMPSTMARTRIEHSLKMKIIHIWYDTWVIFSYIQKQPAKQTIVTFLWKSEKTGILHLTITKLFIQEVVVDKKMLHYWEKQPVTFHCTSSPSWVLKAFSCSGNGKILVVMPYIIIGYVAAWQTEITYYI